ncbi:beta-lactamase-like protein [Gilbertella persicaria]|uniref:beta-lactamase-like protein n=1 Tax=Gilbertella persicaria TaxID=101096 RepID=UPI00221F3874|nr:beta-lactamase-like protein [Gilbertella persicaria]KAI8067641.1 beta-lactamase-like protein [Gilbertella persicaria]
MPIQVVPLGAGQDVGRSCILVTIGGKNIMFDCGMHMGYQDVRRFPDFSYISKTGNYTDILDAVIISHFHLDHCGALPFFTEMCGYDGPIYMTHPTKAICPILLEDYRKITVERKGETNFFTSDMIKNCMKKVIPMNLHQTIKVDDEIEIKAYYAGHVLGAAMIYVRVGQESVVYTGDYNMTPDRHLGSAWIDKVRPDVLITESTYATTIRDSKRSRERDFLTKVHECVANGGNVIIPVFALGRAQELCILIESYWDRMGLDIPIYFSTGLTERATEYYKLFINWTNQKIKSTFAQRNAFDFKHIKPWHKSYLDAKGPMVLFATPGMLNAGTSLQVFQKWAPDPKNMVIMPGYCVAGTVGAKVLLGQKLIEVDKYTKFEVNLQVRNLSFSAHADAKGIMQLIRMCEPRNVVLVHGERGKMDFLRSNIMKEFGIACYMPANGCSIHMETSRALEAKISTDLLKSLLPSTSTLCPTTSVPIHATLLMHIDTRSKQQHALPSIEIVNSTPVEKETKKALFFQVEKAFDPTCLLPDVTQSSLEDIQRRILDVLQVALARSVGKTCLIERTSSSIDIQSVCLWLLNSDCVCIKWSFEDEDLASFILGTINTVFLFSNAPISITQDVVWAYSNSSTLAHTDTNYTPVLYNSRIKAASNLNQAPEAGLKGVLYQPSIHCTGTNTTERPLSILNQLTKIALIDQDRASCSIADNIKQAQDQGAIGVILYGDTIHSGNEEDTSIMIPLGTNISITVYFVDIHIGKELSEKVALYQATPVSLLSETISVKPYVRVLMLPPSTGGINAWEITLLVVSTLLVTSFLASGKTQGGVARNQAMIHSCYVVIMHWHLWRKRKRQAYLIEQGLIPVPVEMLPMGKHILQASQLEALFPIHTLTNNHTEVCVVCLEPMMVGSKVRKLPCEHTYHGHCIDPWLTQKCAECPLCKYDCSQLSKPQQQQEEQQQKQTLLFWKWLCFK